MAEIGISAIREMDSLPDAWRRFRNQFGKRLNQAVKAPVDERQTAE
jgi:hypothetical protein